MADNTTISASIGGDAIRDIDRGGVKTQVMQLDFGGANGQSEQLVTALNPLPVEDVTLLSAGSNDAPLSVNLCGDDNGDFAGVNLLELLMDDASGFGINVRAMTPQKYDSNGAAIASDCPNTYELRLSAGQVAFIDTAGYSSAYIQSIGNSVVALASSIDKNVGVSTWAATQGVSISASPTVASNTIAGTLMLVPCAGRFLRLTGSTAGTTIVTLRNSSNLPLGFVYQNNMAAIGGSAPASAGVAGMLAVGGNIAAGTAATANPVLVGGVDAGGLTRRLLTDPSGGVVNGSSAASNGQTLGTVVTAATPAANVVKATAGRLYSINVGNPNTAAVYLKIFNAATATLGTTSAAQNIMIPASSTLSIPINDNGLYFSTGIVTAVTGGSALNDNTAIATGCVVNYSFM